jgi:hypothetical protein
VIDRTRLRQLLQPGWRIGMGDGVGIPGEGAVVLSELAAEIGNLDLLLGWVPELPDGIDLAAFRDVRALMGGYGLRRPIDAGLARYVPSRLGSAPALLRGALRLGVVLASVRQASTGFHFTTEVSWQRAAVDAGAVVAGIERPASPLADAGPPLPGRSVVVVGSSPDEPVRWDWGDPDDATRELGERAAALVPGGSAVQFAPGPLGTALLDALQVPVRIDTGIITDPVVALERRGLLLGVPTAPYLAGTETLYEWADGRGVVDGVERTHDPARLGAGAVLVAVNTALEIDVDGQVNVETAGQSALAGIGGHPDYAAAASRATGGLSIVAVPTRRGANQTLVDRLSAPASTPSHDIDIVVTEIGTADLRGLDRTERRRAITSLWRRI